MYSRHLRVTLALAIAALLSLAPAAMAISGSAAQGQAGAAQYVAPSTGDTPSGEQPSQGGEIPEADVDSGNGEPDGEVIPAAGDSGGAAPTAPAPLTEAAAPAAGELPFTGYLAVTVLLFGAMSLLAGVWLRRRTSPVA